MDALPRHAFADSIWQRAHDCAGDYVEEATTQVIEEKLLFDGSYCRNTSTCSYVISEVVGGEVVRVTLTAENVVGNSSAWTWEDRWETLPFGLMNVTYEEYIGLSTVQSAINLSWGPPP